MGDPHELLEGILLRNEDVESSLSCRFLRESGTKIPPARPAHSIAVSQVPPVHTGTRRTKRENVTGSRQQHTSTWVVLAREPPDSPRRAYWVIWVGSRRMHDKSKHPVSGRRPLIGSSSSSSSSISSTSSNCGLLPNQRILILCHGSRCSSCSPVLFDSRPFLCGRFGRGESSKPVTSSILSVGLIHSTVLVAPR
jgi:hypothetical protein